MNTPLYYPTARHIGEQIDSRTLMLSLSFHRFTRAQTFELGEAALTLARRLLGGSFVTEWSFQHKPVKDEDIMRALRRGREADKYLHFRFRAMARSEAVTDLKSFRRFDREARYPAGGDSPDRDCAPGYRECFRELFCREGMDAPEIKAALMALLEKQGGPCIGDFGGTDAVGLFSTGSHLDAVSGEWQAEPLHGTLMMAFRVFCFRNELDELAEELRGWAKAMAGSFSDVNAIVGLAATPTHQYPGEHMKYFGAGLADRGGRTKDGTPIDHLPCYYLCGAEWGTCVSALTRELLPELRTRAASGGICAEELPSGAIYLGLRKPVREVCTEDLLALKALLYPALYPGASSVPLDAFLDENNYSFLAKPRRYWEMTPIFSEEVNVTDGEIRYTHRLE